MKTKVLFLAVVLIFCVSKTTEAQVNTHDSLALIALYNSTDGANWSNPWPINMSINWWTGVVIENNRVTKLFLNDFGLNGTIPPEIGSLDSLNILHLEGNSLQGSLPSEIGNLTKLTDLDLTNNLLTGNIPTELFNLLNIKYINISLNYFTGNLPPQVGNLPSILYLNVGSNNLSGVLPLELYNLVTLNTLCIGRNQFEGSISNSIDSLVDLNWLYLTDNNFDDIPDFTFLCDNHSLNTLNCDSNKLTFEDLESNAGISWQHFFYSPQDSVLNGIDTLVDVGSNISFTSLVGGTQNHYQWYKNGILLNNDTFPVLNINPVAFSDSGTYTCKITNSIVNGLTLYRKLIKLNVKDTTSNIIKPVIYNNYFVRPNPCLDYVTIEPANYSKVEVLNIFGEILYVYMPLFKNNQTINLSYLPKGLYYLRIFSDEKVLSMKIIKN